MQIGNFSKNKLPTCVNVSIISLINRQGSMIRCVAQSIPPRRTLTPDIGGSNLDCAERELKYSMIL